MTPRIILCAGETSGDQLGAGLIEALRERFPDARFAGIGGDAMRAAGMDTWFDASELAVMGLAEVLAHLPRLLRLRKAFRQRTLDWKPDVFIGIDAPDFNLGVERWLKQRGVRTVHDVSPSVWAWRENRALKIGESADRVLCLFPMEPPIYARHGVDATFIGHPLADAIPLQPDRDVARAALGESNDAPILALLPGSRLGEIRRMLPDFAEAARRLAADVPGLRVLVPAANAQCRSAIDDILGHAPAFRVIDGRAQRIMIASDAVLLASGTAALEAMLCKRPMVVGHRIAPLTYRIVRLFGMLKSAHVSLPNVLAGEALIPELLQDDCTPDNLHAALLHWFRDEEAAAALQPRFLAIHQALRRDASARAADAVAQLLRQP
ncbi:lipid-A-disaccharide synthase [Thermomonas sp. LB-4]|uniref:lipid-A-disaccharide synthase n=1 Tax=Thermomonas sp. LB-4 TaxID=3102790 RepID=UPI002EDB842A